uniref:DNA-directed RNA polymerase subunit beta n=1 Tax=Anthurium amnicola TaxID=1678845 RepID=A0A1D1Z8B3_9ARAE
MCANLYIEANWPAPPSPFFFLTSPGPHILQTLWVPTSATSIVPIPMHLSIMGRSLVLTFLFLTLVSSPGRTVAAAVSSPHPWNPQLRRPLLPPGESNPDHLPPDVVTSLSHTEETSDQEAERGDVLSNSGVDFGTKAWPYVYYSRRDRKGTVDWGIRSWPYVYYAKREAKQHLEGTSSDARDIAGISNMPEDVHHGRKDVIETRI